ncbi:MAG: hypothetical protein ACM3N1_00255 [Accumulibacter sp.]
MLCFVLSVTVALASASVDSKNKDGYSDGYTKGYIDGKKQGQKDCKLLFLLLKSLNEIILKKTQAFNFVT